MPYAGLTEVIGKGRVFRRVQEGLEDRSRRQLVCGLNGGALSLWLAALYKNTSRSFLVVVPNVTMGQRVVGDLQTLLGGEACLFPALEVLPGRVLARSMELETARLTVMERLIHGRSLVVAPIEAVAQRLMPPSVMGEAFLTLQTGQELNWDELLVRLEYLGYHRMDLVEAPGQYSVRGGLVDVYPLISDLPFRIEFCGDEICSLRSFAPATQRSVADVSSVSIGPGREVLFPEAVWGGGIAAWEADYQSTLQRLKGRDQGAYHALYRNMGERLERARRGLIDEGLPEMLAYFYPQPQYIWHYFVSPPLVVLEDPVRLAESMNYALKESAEMAAELLPQGKMLPGQTKMTASFTELLGLWSRGPILGFSPLPQQVEGLAWNDTFNVKTGQPPKELTSRPNFMEEMLGRWQAERLTQVLVVSGPQRARHLAQILRDDGLPAILSDNHLDHSLSPGQLIITWGALSQGTELPDDRLVVLTEQEIYGRQRKPRPSITFQEGVHLNAYSELAENDYIVHIQHGIGRYKGIYRLEVGGVEKDYLLIQYAGQDRLYVPVEQISLVHKYVGGGEEHSPRLSRLSSGEWSRAKSKVKSSVQNLAKELLQLYAARESVDGHAFNPDTVWQQEFEEAFPYIETPDQMRAITETKADMQRPKPMDRLLCGDVGYGKTEVALRAAFKAVMENKQVAVLVPTTILAQQHFRTFSERFSASPVRVEVLSRFRSAREQTDIVRALGEGLVDIIIGTHRLLSRDVKFKELGLLVIDEEQRFGVSHKEKIKQWRQAVDVLTMSATPIPRTLHMSMVGVRDMSLIETAPEDRYPVQTYVVEYSDELIRGAIRREIGRGGQVYLVHNRIVDIEGIARQIQQLVPEARIGIGHGRLREDQLELVMLDFIEGRYDVLVCTTIVENGLDIPNVNTLIVDEADNMGLAQLYQLRGRVGRSNRLAYAYFAYRGGKVVSALAEKRLAAIKESTALGSGFKIALRDLELRGAGNLLGSEQHGHMQSVGFNLYCQLLEEAVKEQKEGGPLVSEKGKPSVELNIDAYLEDDYISGANLKMAFYHRLVTAETAEEIAEVEGEMQDRFGNPPPLTSRLITMARLRILVLQTMVSSVQQQGNEVLVRFDSGHPYKGEVLLRLAQRFPRRLSFSAIGGLTMRVRVFDLDQEGILSLLQEVFLVLKSLAPAPAEEVREA